MKRFYNGTVRVRVVTFVLFLTQSEDRRISKLEHLEIRTGSTSATWWKYQEVRMPLFEYIYKFL